MKLASRPALAAASMLLSLSLGATACSDDSGGSDATSQPPLPSGEPSKFSIETTTTIGRVVGRLPKEDQKRVANAITPVVQRWFNAAYVGGDYPRKDFSDAFPGFTAGARAEARRDIELMSNDAHRDEDQRRHAEDQPDRPRRARRPQARRRRDRPVPAGVQDPG